LSLVNYGPDWADLTWNVDLNVVHQRGMIRGASVTTAVLKHLVGGIPGGTGTTIQVQRVGSPSTPSSCGNRVWCAS
jgi:hypothetical protein